MAKSIQDERLIQFLMGLNDVYVAGKSSMLMLSSLPSATNQNTLGQRSGYYESKGNKTTIICSHSKKPRHFVDKCYKIIGFPSDFKFTKTKRFQGNVKSNVAYIEGTQGQSGAHFNGEGQGQHFTQDQYSQLIHMLQNVRMNQSEGATQHMCFDSKIFLELNTLKTLVFVDHPNSHRVKGPSMKRPLAFGKARAGLYLLKSSF
ncbi:hypothetical protein KY285_020700 [Solanum tuberosum]|nr:hypothetical protein KY285_020700 [Solanum tuberosum]